MNTRFSRANIRQRRKRSQNSDYIKKVKKRTRKHIIETVGIDPAGVNTMCNLFEFIANILQCTEQTRSIKVHQSIPPTVKIRRIRLENGVNYTKDLINYIVASRHATIRMRPIILVAQISEPTRT